MDAKSFADNLRRLRLEKGYTQEKLAKELDVTPPSVSRWECGTTLPDVMLLPAIARVYGVTVDDLYRGETSTYPNLAQRLLAVYESTGRSEDFVAAEQEFVKLIAGEHTADDLRSFGVLYHYMTKHCAALALNYLEAAINAAGDERLVRSSAAQQKIALLCDLGRGADEAAHYDRELEKDQADVQRWILCVVAHYLAGENERALELVQDALSRFPESSALYIYAGDICQALKLYDLAFDYWRRVKELDKGPLDAYYSMGFCYEKMGQYEKAYQIWRELQQELICRGLMQERQFTKERMRFCMERMR